MITCFRAVGPYRSDQNGLSGDVGIAPLTFTALISAALATANIPSVKATINALARMGLSDWGEELLAIIKKSKDASIRVSILKTLNKLNAKELDTALEIALQDSDNTVRSKALEILPDSEIDENVAVNLFEKIKLVYFTSASFCTW